MVLGLPWILKMTNKAKKFHSLSRRIVFQFCTFTLVLSAIYGFFSFMLMYNLEDKFLEQEVTKEANYLSAQYKKLGHWPKARGAHMTLHYTPESFPDDFRDLYFEEPKRTEFYGNEGRHYHLYKFPEHPDVYLVAEVSQKLLVRPIREYVFNFLFIFGTILTIVAFIIAYMIGCKTAKPLKALADLVDGVAPENIPDTFAHNFPNNEIGVLARTLEKSMQQISKALEREKCFTRDASHELRTPVAIVKNAVEVYQEKNPQNDTNHELIARISEAAMQMEQTVSTLLVLAREEQTAVEKEPVKLLPIVEQSILDHGYLLQDKPVDVEVSDNCNTQIIAQKGMLKVLLDNLISNAFQYTHQGKVSVGFVDNQLIIKDTGTGIEQDISDKITESAVKGSQSTGYGFGLSIVKRLCEHQAWSLMVESGEGTTVSVAFTEN